MTAGLYFADFETKLINVPTNLGGTPGILKQHKVIMAGVIGSTGTKVEVFRDSSEGEAIELFVNHLTRDKVKRRVYFHNLGRFDGVLLMAYISNLKDTEKPRFILRDNRYYKIT